MVPTKTYKLLAEIMFV